MDEQFNCPQLRIAPIIPFKNRTYEYCHLIYQFEKKALPLGQAIYQEFCHCGKTNWYKSCPNYQKYSPEKIN